MRAYLSLSMNEICPCGFIERHVVTNLVCRHNRRVVIRCHYAAVVLCSRILSQLFIYPVYHTFDGMETPVSRRTHAVVGIFRLTARGIRFIPTDVFERGKEPGQKADGAQGAEAVRDIVDDGKNAV